MVDTYIQRPAAARPNYAKRYMRKRSSVLLEAQAASLDSKLVTHLLPPQSEGLARRTSAQGISDPGLVEVHCDSLAALTADLSSAKRGESEFSPLLTTQHLSDSPRSFCIETPCSPIPTRTTTPPDFCSPSSTTLGLVPPGKRGSAGRVSDGAILRKPLLAQQSLPFSIEEDATMPVSAAAVPSAMGRSRAALDRQRFSTYGYDSEGYPMGAVSGEMGRHGPSGRQTGGPSSSRPRWSQGGIPGLRRLRNSLHRTVQRSKTTYSESPTASETGGGVAKLGDALTVEGGGASSKTNPFIVISKDSRSNSLAPDSTASGAEVGSPGGRAGGLTAGEALDSMHGSAASADGSSGQESGTATGHPTAGELIRQISAGDASQHAVFKSKQNAELGARRKTLGRSNTLDGSALQPPLLAGLGRAGVPVDEQQHCSLDDVQLADGLRPDSQDRTATVKRHGSRLSFREQLSSFFQVSDNRLAMKLFGSKRALNKEKLRQKEVGPCIVHPCSKFRFYWDFFMLTLLIANLIILPVVIAFFYEDFNIHWILFNCASDTMFILDIIINFRTGIILNELGDEIILNPREIAVHYLKTWFVVDFVSSIPMDYIFLIFTDAEESQFFRAGRALRILRLAKLLSLLRLLRLTRLIRYVQQWQEFLNVANMIMRIINLIMLMLLLAHWNGCLQFLVPMLQGFPSDSWVSINELKDADWVRQYTWAIFKALSHMLCIGYGRYPPISVTDMWLTMTSMVTGATCYAIFVGHMTTLIQSFDTSKRAYRDKLKQIQEYMFYRKLPRSLRERVMDYFEHRYQGKMFDEESILVELSECLREEIVGYNCRALVAAVPFFAHADPNFVSDVVTKLKYEIFQPGDYIIREGTIGHKMYFIQIGIVDIVTKDGEVATSLSDGSYFGEICLLTNARRVASVRAETYCNLWSLSVHHFNAVLDHYPLMRETLRGVAAERLTKIGRDPSMIGDREDLMGNFQNMSEVLKSWTPCTSRDPSDEDDENGDDCEGLSGEKGSLCSDDAFLPADGQSKQADGLSSKGSGSTKESKKQKKHSNSKKLSTKSSKSRQPSQKEQPPLGRVGTGSSKRKTGGNGQKKDAAKKTKKKKSSCPDDDMKESFV